MRRGPIALLLLAALAAGDETLKLDIAVKGFKSPDLAERQAASRLAQKEVVRLLKPLLDALKDPDPEVRRRAKAAIAMELPTPVSTTHVPRWHPMKAAGKPDAIANQDHPNAWASQHGNMGLQWLELGYVQPMQVDRIRIYEVNRAGAVAEVIAYDGKGKQHSVWKGVDPTRQPGVFGIKLKQTPFKVVRLRIVLDTNRVSGWNEIDAVEIIGPKGRQWAAEARASSYYGQR